MDALPVEVLRLVGSYLNQVNQKSCTLVCQSWYKIFQPLVFQKAVLTSPTQLLSYMQQKPTLKSLTQSLHFNVPLTDETLLEFATTCPRVHTLTLFINLLNNLSIPETVSVITTHWSRTLIKIRMDELLLPKVLPLLCHQLQEVTGSWGSLLDADRCLIAMPKLFILDVDNDDEYELTIPVLDLMRIAYPRLKKLTASYFNLKQVHDHTPVVVPFPLVRSFHLLNSNDLDCGLRQIMKMFSDLKEYSVIRSYVSDSSTEDRKKLFKDLALVHPSICDLKLDLFTDLALYSCFTRITSLQLEAIPEEDIISHRVSVDLIKLVSGLPLLKHFKLYGIVHLESNESLNHYLLNTYQSGCTLTDQLEDDEEEEQEDENDLFEISTDDIHYSKRELYKNILVKKILPKTPIWNIQPNLSTYNPSSLLDTAISKLVSLTIEMTTLRNPTFQWLKYNCPLLQELHVLKTEPYPYAVIELGPNVHTFTLSFNRRYDSLELPILCLNNTVSLEYVGNKYKQTEYAKQMTRITNAYKIHVHFTSSLREFKFCGHLIFLPE
ncbi:hypothetical protein EDC94DRAFT_665415 [Helicostylum pulchrum]|uniref:F-box domain-containing protein n=1 Tax=Helicostylum pulchrum TaxID=562976 RepID=A0ABP9XV74_9FUNG|nr:hypothetical protein EDC94DRAFT_665415 [Helicostylum pulchrum]